LYTHKIKIKDLEKLIETGFDGELAYAICCIGDCHKKCEAPVHYGDIEGAKRVAFGKVLAHIKIDHKIEIEERWTRRLRQSSFAPEFFFADGLDASSFRSENKFLLIMRYVSKENPIPSEDFGPNPYLSENGIKRMAAEEEAARDLLKHPKQLLADIHDESLDNSRSRGESVSRSIARLASLQLRNNELAEENNKLMRRLAIVGTTLAFLSLVSPIILGLLDNHKLQKRIEMLESLHTTPLPEPPKIEVSQQETTPSAITPLLQESPLETNSEPVGRGQ
jgi:hypothetical protein